MIPSTPARVECLKNHQISKNLQKCCRIGHCVDLEWSFWLLLWNQRGFPACSETNSCLDQSSRVEGWGSSTSKLPKGIGPTRKHLLKPNHPLKIRQFQFNHSVYQVPVPGCFTKHWWTKWLLRAFWLPVVRSYLTNVFFLCRGAWMGIRPPIRPGAPTGRRTPPLLTTTWVLSPKSLAGSVRVDCHFLASA